MKAVPLAFIFLSAGASTLRARDDAETVEALLANAEARLAEKDVSGAAAALGEAASAAHRANDLLLEQRVAETLSSVGFGAAPPDALSALLKPLDPRRGGAFVSAHGVAIEIILAATRRGDTTGVSEAAAALAAFSKTAKSGQCAAAAALHAQAMKSVAEKKDKDAVRLLGQALAAYAKHGWTDLEIIAGTELSAVALRLGDSAQARSALEIVASEFGESIDPRLAREWRNLARARLAGAPADVLAPLESALARIPKTTSAGAAGGTGGPARAPGDLSKVGRALTDRKAPAMLVTASRGREGFAIREGFDKSFAATKEPRHGETYHADGGITLSFVGRSVALAMVDPVGNRGQPGEGSSPSLRFARYPLAEGESYILAKTGVVTIGTGPSR